MIARGVVSQTDIGPRVTVIRVTVIRVTVIETVTETGVGKGIVGERETITEVRVVTERDAKKTLPRKGGDPCQVMMMYGRKGHPKR